MGPERKPTALGPSFGQTWGMSLVEDPFDWRATKNGQVHVSRGGRTVTVLRGRSAAALLAKLDGADDESAQQLLARATGHYRHVGRPRG